MTHDQIIEVAVASKFGHPVEFRSRNTDLPFVLAGVDPNLWSFLLYEYRVQPVPLQPREWWITFKSDLEPSKYAIAWPFHPPGEPSIHVREVLE